MEYLKLDVRIFTEAQKLYLKELPDENLVKQAKENQAKKEERHRKALDKKRKIDEATKTAEWPAGKHHRGAIPSFGIQPVLLRVVDYTTEKIILQKSA